MIRTERSELTNTIDIIFVLVKRQEQGLRRLKNRSLLIVNACAEHCRSTCAEHCRSNCFEVEHNAAIGFFLQALNKRKLNIFATDYSQPLAVHENAIAKFTD